MQFRWATHYNSFVFNTEKYPNATEMVQEIHSLGSHVTFWITGHINVESPNWQHVRHSTSLSFFAHLSHF